MRRFVIIGLIGSVLVGFQNCAPAKFGKVTASSDELDKAATCDDAEVAETLRAKIKNLEVPEAAVLTACADVTMTAAQSNPANGANEAIRFFNTCGYRYCQKVEGALSGRVVENNAGKSVVSCTFDVVPKAVSKTCQRAVTVRTSDWISEHTIPRAELAELCRDGALKTVAEQYPTNPALYVRWVFACGNRACIKKGLGAAGRVIEDSGAAGGALVLECTREELFNKLGAGDVAKEVWTTAAAVSAACQDGAYATANASLPGGDALKMLRFMNTCGKRACEAQGFKAGRLVETDGTGAVLRCTK